jgi:hypothetical protein
MSPTNFTLANIFAFMPFARLMYFVAVMMIAIACSKRVAPTPAPATEAPKNIDIQEIDFEYFSGKARMNVRDDKKEKDVKATIRIRKDSVIWMDLSVVGVSGARVLINSDSLTVRSNVDKEYFVFEFSELSKRFNFPITYEIVQAAMLGNLIYDRRPQDNVRSDGTFNILEQKLGTITIANYINMASTKLEKVELHEANTNNSLVIQYSNFQTVGTKVFPFDGHIEILYKTAAGIIQNTITFEYNKAEVGDRELRFPFNIPKKYERR